MKQFIVTKGNGAQQVVVTEQAGFYTARLYINYGDTATLQTWKGKTEGGARRWAAKVLN